MGIPEVRKAARKLHRDRKDSQGAARWETRLQALAGSPVPEERLWAAVLEEALLEVRRPLPRTWRERVGNRWRTVEFPGWWRETELKQWFRANGQRVGEFGWICRELGLPKGAIRRYALGG